MKPPMTLFSLLFPVPFPWERGEGGKDGKEFSYTSKSDFTAHDSSKDRSIGSLNARVFHGIIKPSESHLQSFPQCAPGDTAVL